MLNVRRNVCPVTITSAEAPKVPVGQHCFHVTFSPLDQPTGGKYFPEVCCRCAPVWLRVTIPVAKVGPAELQYANEHPYVHFEEIHVSRLVKASGLPLNGR